MYLHLDFQMIVITPVYLNVKFISIIIDFIYKDTVEENQRDQTLDSDTVEENPKALPTEKPKHRTDSVSTTASEVEYRHKRSYRELSIKKVQRKSSLQTFARENTTEICMLYLRSSTV